MKGISAHVSVVNGPLIKMILHCQSSFIMRSFTFCFLLLTLHTKMDKKKVSIFTEFGNKSCVIRLFIVVKEKSTEKGEIGKKKQEKSNI